MRQLVHLGAILLTVVLLVGMPSVGTGPVVAGLVVILGVWLAVHLWIVRRGARDSD